MRPGPPAESWALVRMPFPKDGCSHAGSTSGTSHRSPPRDRWHRTCARVQGWESDAHGRCGLWAPHAPPKRSRERCDSKIKSTVYGQVAPAPMRRHCFLCCCFWRRLPPPLAVASPPRQRSQPTRHRAAATSGYHRARRARPAYARRPPRLPHGTTLSTAHSRTAQTRADVGD